MRDSLKKNGFTAVDHITFDFILPTLSPPAQLVLLRIYRQTIGWNNPFDSLSLSQICKKTGFKSKNTIVAALRELIDKNLIIISGEERKIQTYGINWKTVESYAKKQENDD